LVVLATMHLMTLKRVPVKVIQRIVGCWIWVFMACRAGMSTLTAVYHYAVAYGEDASPELWESVRVEFEILVAIAPFLSTNLESPWNPRVFMTDASEEGFGIVVTSATR